MTACTYKGRPFSSYAHAVLSIITSEGRVPLSDRRIARMLGCKRKAVERARNKYGIGGSRAR